MRIINGRTWAAELDSPLYAQIEAIAQHYEIEMTSAFKDHLAEFCLELFEKQEAEIQRRMREPLPPVTLTLEQLLAYAERAGK